jgi:hypothetical protein
MTAVWGGKSVHLSCGIGYALSKLTISEAKHQLRPNAVEALAIV